MTTKPLERFRQTGTRAARLEKRCVSDAELLVEAYPMTVALDAFGTKIEIINVRHSPGAKDCASCQG